MKLIGCGIVTWQLLMIFPPSIINEVINAIQLYIDQSLLKKVILMNLLWSGGMFIIGALDFIRLFYLRIKTFNHTQEAITTYPLFKRVTQRFDFCFLIICISNIMIGFWMAIKLLFQFSLSSTLFISELLFAELIQLMLVSFLCFFFFHTKFFRHHFFSFGVILVGFLVLLSYYPFFRTGYLRFSLLSIALVIPSSVTTIWEKWLMQNKNVLPSLILFLQGIGAILGSIIIIEIAQRTTCTESWLLWGDFCTLNEPIETWAGFNAFSEGLNPMLVAFNTIFLGVLELAYKLVNYYLSPPYVSIASFIVIVMAYIVGFMVAPVDFSVGLKVILCTCLVLTLFGSLIYNEMLILYFCGLERNTKKVIMDRGDEDDLNILINMREIKKLEDDLK